MPRFGEDAPEDETTGLLVGNSSRKLDKTLDRLQTGLKNWIKVNKSRKEQLSQSVDKCENIKEHTSDVDTLMEEASRIQKSMKDSLDKTNRKMEQQTKDLGTLKSVAAEFGKKMRKQAEETPWTPRTPLIYATACCLVVAAIFFSIPYILNACGVYRINKPQWGSTGFEKTS